MKPRIDIEIHNYEGELEELCDLSTFEPYEVYINNERIYTSEMVEELEAENAKLRRLLSSALIGAGYHGRQYVDAYLREEEGTTLLDELRAVGIEIKP